MGNYFPLVSFSFHGVMVLFSLYLVLSKTYVPKWKDYPIAYVTMLFFAVVAILVNLIFKTTDMMFLNTGYGMPFSFLLTDYGRAVYYVFMALLAFVALALPFLPWMFQKKESLIIRRNHRINPCKGPKKKLVFGMIF